jgi:capping protein (actin filament) muscle Z-line, alpha
MVIDDDDALEAGLAPALRTYNTTQLIAVDVPGLDHQVIISDASCLPSSSESTSTTERFVDPRSKTSFEFDHIRLETSNTESYEPNTTAEPFRAELDKASITHLTDHYYNGTSAVLSQPLVDSEESAKFVIQIVGNKYNPTNYW